MLQRAWVHLSISIVTVDITTLLTWIKTIAIAVVVKSGLTIGVTIVVVDIATCSGVQSVGFAVAIVVEAIVTDLGRARIDRSVAVVAVRLTIVLTSVVAVAIVGKVLAVDAVAITIVIDHICAQWVRKVRDTITVVVLAVTADFSSSRINGWVAIVAIDISGLVFGAVDAIAVTVVVDALFTVAVIVVIDKVLTCSVCCIGGTIAIVVDGVLTQLCSARVDVYVIVVAVKRTDILARIATVAVAVEVTTTFTIAIIIVVDHVVASRVYGIIETVTVGVDAIIADLKRCRVHVRVGVIAVSITRLLT